MTPNEKRLQRMADAIEREERDLKLTASAPDLESVKEEVRRRIDGISKLSRAAYEDDDRIENLMYNAQKKELQSLLTWLENKKG